MYIKYMHSICIPYGHLYQLPWRTMKDHESARSQLTSHITWFPSVSCAPPHISDNTSTLLMYIAKSGSSIFAFLSEPLVYLEWLLKEQRCACNDRDPWHERPWHPHELAVKTHTKNIEPKILKTTIDSCGSPAKVSADAGGSTWSKISREWKWKPSLWRVKLSVLTFPLCWQCL